MGGREANALGERSTAPETGSRFIVMFWIVCVLSELRALRLRPPLERSTACERVLMVVSISRRVCVHSNGHYFETDATSGAVNRSRGGCDGHLHSSDGLGALKYHLDPWNKELELTCAWNSALKIGTPVGSIVKERCAKYGEKRRTRF